MITAHTNVTILIAEDDEGHAELIMEQLRSAGVSNEIIRFQDGQELWDYLMAEGRRTSPYDGHGFLLLLDIVMPRLDGLEILRRIKTDKQWHNLPIIMLTTTDDPREIESCYTLGCNCYITKPMEYERFTEMLKRLGLFLMVVQTPKIPPQDG
ncbi:MAG: response regulator [Verrucomicrobia bacterium]|nr:response regulator [Verrucomicrobiota bacterium]MBU1736252.1 response regulator [Verrucomicrobiota bacterium]MBU1856966.1 response regulator [Verrucomicrobiota bacterium]